MLDQASTGVPALPALGYDPLDRTHRLTPPSGMFERLSRASLDWLERQVARHSLHPDQPVYDNAWFPWASEVAAAWPAVRAELDRVMTRQHQMPSFQDILDEVRDIQNDDQWKTFFLAGIGMDCSANAQRCPATMHALKNVPGLRTAFFSILAPGKHIPAHRGAYNGLLRLHLGLQVPAPAERCRVRIGNRIAHWSEGELLIFDDTFDHEVWNDTNGWRVVLFVDFIRPMHAPWKWINEGFIALGRLMPFLRAAGARQKRWAKVFYGDEK